MSLQVWIPMINDLKNQGLANTLELTNDGVEKNDDGKIGSCFKITQAKDMGLTPDIWDYTAKDICFGGWIKINKEELNNIIQKYSYDEIFKASGGCLLGNGYYSGLSLRWKTNPLYQNKILTNVYIYSFLREKNTDKISITNSYDIPFDTWIHIFLVKNIETKKLSFYINGELYSTTSAIDIPNMEDINFLIAHRGWDYGDGRGSSGCFYYNDIRLYDNILSSKEIKEISKGLIIHYPFNKINIKENLLNPLIEYDTSGYQNNGKTNENYITTVCEDSPRYISASTFDNSYITFISPLKGNNPEYSFSFWYKGTNASANQCIYNCREKIGDPMAIFIINKQLRFDDGAQRQFSYAPTSDWQHIVITRSIEQIKLYVNGTEIESYPSTSFTQTATYASIGMSSTNTQSPSGNALTGSLSDFRIYSTVLSDEDILELYNTSLIVNDNGSIMTYELIEE